MKTLVFGANGQIASELRASLKLGFDTFFVDSATANFLDPGSVVRTIRDLSPAVIINAAAYTAVDKCESEIEIATKINAEILGVMGEEAKKLSASVIHYSTDYVFDGNKPTAYSESDLPNPLNVYGRTKLLGEKYLTESGCSSVILRVSWVYGEYGQNFMKTMLRLGREKDELRIVNDQIGAPTWSGHIAEATKRIISSGITGKEGLYHLSPKGEVSWYGFAKNIFETASKICSEYPLKVKSVVPITTEEYRSPARRPLNSRLNAEKIKEVFEIELPEWEEPITQIIQKV